MDTARWKASEEFLVLDLVARFKFKSSSGLSFELGTKSDSIQIPGMEEPLVLGEGRVFNIIGWLDAHHPCEGSHRLQLRVGLPDQYVSWESMRDLVPPVKAALGLPIDESYRVSLVGLSEQTLMEEPQSGFTS